MSVSSPESPKPPSARDHLVGSRRFAQEADALKASNPGWAVTALFYSAVHMVRAYLSTKGIEIASHEAMNQHWNNPVLKPIKADYRYLKQVSEQHRYYLVTFTPEQVDQVRVHLQKIMTVVGAKTAIP